MRRITILAFVLIGALALYACAPSPAPLATPVPSAVASTPTPSPVPSAPPSSTPVLIDVVLFLPDVTGAGLVATPAKAEDSPEGLLYALVAAGALPDVDYGQHITLTVADETLTFDGVETSGVFVHLDVSDAFAGAVKQSDAAHERLILQSLANTMITRYRADGLILSIAGTDLETLRERYNRPIGFDELAQTRQTDPVGP